MKMRCPGMDPAYFKPTDIKLGPCLGCGIELEFWKDDVKISCHGCGQVNFNPNLGNSCLVYCKKADECVGNNDIEEWRRLHSSETCAEADEISFP